MSFGFGNLSAPAATKAPFSFSTATTQSTASTTGAAAAGGSFSLSALSSATNPSSSTGFSLGGSSTAKVSTASTGFSFGTPSSSGDQKPLTLGSLGSATTTAASTGFSLGGPARTTAATGFTLAGGTTAATAQGLTLGAATTTTSTSGSGLSLGSLAAKTNTTTASTTGLTLGGFGKPAATGTGLTLGGLGATTTTAATTGGLSLGGLGGSAAPSTTAVTSADKGLGGVDPKAGDKSKSGAAGKSGDGKSVKEQNIPNELVTTVTKFKEHVKEQKSIREKITMMSSQPLYKVQDQTSELKHLLTNVAMGLHRNVVAVDKLKRQITQELHSTEMAHRTKETPAGLQYENTAPSEYFRQLLDSFDSRMCLYRKLIEDTEGYLLGAQQGAVVSPRELFICMKRLHETFLALAAQLQGFHERVKVHKEQYLSYRKIFHHEDLDVFAARKKAVDDKNKLKQTKQPLGPTPFTGLSNYAAMMMSAAMYRQNTQPAGAVAAPTGFGFGAQTNQPPTGGFLSGAGATTSTSLFGAKPTTTQSSFGGAFGQPAQNTFSFGSTSKPTGFGFGTTNPSTSSTGFTFGSATTSAAKPGGFGTFGSGTSTGGLFGSQSATVKPLGVAAPQSLGSSAPTFALSQPPTKRK